MGRRMWLLVELACNENESFLASLSRDVVLLESVCLYLV